MKIFGHYVTRLFLALAGLDTILILAALSVLQVELYWQGRSFGSLINLDINQAALTTGVFLLITTSAGLYNSDAAQDFRTFLKRFILTSQLVFVLGATAFGLSKAAARFPLGWHIGMLSLAIAVFMLVVFTAHVMLVWRFGLPFIKKRLLVLGEGQSAQAVTQFASGPGRSQFHHVRTISSRAPTAAAALREKTAPLSVVAETLRADEIVVAVDDKRRLPVNELLECKLKGIEVIDALTFWEREAGQIDLCRGGAEWLTFSSGFVFDQRRRFLKRGLDIVISASFLIAMLPVILLTASAISIESPGPVFYRQERVGLNGRAIRLWKFRSMRPDAERDGVPRWATTTDDRVTRVGRFIRKVRIDEIPQVINVLAGDMSFIGPRPERPFFVEELRKEIPHYNLRHGVKPGITGWAQVNYPYGASIEDAKRKLSYDLYYIKNNDVFLDLAILMQTVRVVLFAHGAR